MTIRVCKKCQTVLDDENMAKKRAICKDCFKIEYKKNYLKIKDDIKIKRTTLIKRLIEENEQLKQENKQLKKD